MSVTGFAQNVLNTLPGYVENAKEKKDLLQTSVVSKTITVYQYAT